MRIDLPTVSYSQDGILYGKTSASTVLATGLNTADPSNTRMRNLLVMGTDLTVGDMMPIYLDVNAYLAFSADI